MWKYSSKGDFFFNFDLKNGKFWYTDLTNLYVEENITREFIKMRFKDSNPRMDFEEEIVIENLKEMPSSCEILEENNMIKLYIKYSIDSDSFKFSWVLKRGANEIKEILIHPLLLALNSLNQQNTELMDIIRQKDNEIEQYKIEGAVLKRRLIATKKFCKPEFSSKFVQVNVSEFNNYTSNNIDKLKESCKDFIEDNNYSNNNSIIINSNPNNALLSGIHMQKFVKSRKKRALQSRRKQNLEKIKKLAQDLTYENEDDASSD